MIYIDNQVKIEQIRETKTSFKKHVLVKKIVLSDADSLEQFANGPVGELANSLNNFKHKLKDYFFKKLRNMEQDIFAY